jgi:hypothetical protein
MTDGKVYVPGGNALSRYKAGSREPECVAAYRAYMRKYMRKRRLRKRWEAHRSPIVDAPAAANSPVGPMPCDTPL